MRKLLAAAIAMMTLSTAATVTGTVAWFSANQIVTAQGMTVQAQSEEGIVISNAPAGTYNVSADSTNSATAQLKPASTWNCSDWYHSVSTNPGAANDGQAYSEITSNVTNYYATHEFYIRSSAEQLTVQSLNVKSVDAKVGGNAAAQDLSKALRVGVVFDADTAHTAYIYGPVTGFTASYGVHQSTDGETAHTKAVTAVAGNTISSCTGVTTIPANSANGTKATIFVWFEGEDAACMSNNIVANLESLAITVQFSYTKNA